MSTTTAYFDDGIFAEISTVTKEQRNTVAVNYPEPRGGDKVIGELSDFERACRFLWDKKDAEHDVMHQEMRQKRTDERTAEHHRIHAECKLLESLMWSSIQMRFASNTEAMSFDSLGLGKGGTIFATNRNNRPVFGGFGFGIVEVVM